MLRVMGFGAYGLAIVGLLLSFEAVVFLGAALSLAAAGTIFFAADRIIVVLSDIRDRLPKPVPVDAIAAGKPFDGPVRSAAEIEADLKRLRAQA